MKNFTISDTQALIQEVSKYYGLEPDDKLYFKKDANKNPRVHEFVNEILEPYGFKSYSEWQFEHIAGGGSNSMNKIPNLEEGYGSISNGFTTVRHVLTYCYNRYNNSVKIPISRVKEEMEWASELIDEGDISLYSGNSIGKRDDIDAIFDILKGRLAEVALVRDAENHGIDIKIDDSIYQGSQNTDSGRDVKSIKMDGEYVDLDSKIQVKNITHYLLVSQQEYFGDCGGDYYVAYDTQWNPKTTGRRLFSTLTNDFLFGDFEELDGLRVERRGWAYSDDFQELPAGESYKGKKFDRDDNMVVHREELRDMSTFFEEIVPYIN